MKNVKKLFSERQIKGKVKKIAKKISLDYKGKSPVIICLLKGATYFFADLTRKINLPIQVDFVKISSYRSGTTSGEIDFQSDLRIDVKGKDVIIVEDVVDTGNTLYTFLQILKEKNPASVKICAFLDKPNKRLVTIQPDYVCFTVSDGFVIGYGLDYAERYRELPYLAQIIDCDKPFEI